VCPLLIAGDYQWKGEGYLRLRCWNFHNFDLEADEDSMPDILWLSQFFISLDPELVPIFECLVEVKYAEKYQPEPTIREYLNNPAAYRIEKITFGGLTNYYYVYHFSRIIEAYSIAKEEFKKRQKPEGEEDRKVYEAVKKFFDEH
jgi:hypothetical protein